MALHTVMRPGRVVVVGELHGTNQFPDVVADAVEAAARRGLRVRVGLEIPRDEDVAFDAYIDSDGRPKDRARLLREPFWEGKDGRASLAMLRLINRVSLLRSDGRRVALELFDLPRDERFDPKQADARDWLMAEHLADAMKKHQKDAFIVLVGSFHASRAETSTDQQQRYEPMVRRLAGLVPTVVTLLGTHAGGTAWNCSGEPVDCGIHRVRGKDEGDRRPFVLLGGSDEGFDGSVFVGKVTASRPARSPR